MAWLRSTRDGDFETAALLRRDGDFTRLTRLLLARPELSALPQWLADDPAYWSSISPDQLLRDAPLDVPVLHVGGWCDYMLGGTLSADRAFREHSAETAHLVIGPWTHLPWNRLAGASDMGPRAEYSVDAAAQLRFFDFYLKGIGDRPDAVELFDPGRRDWATFDGPPVGSPRSLHLTSTGLAGTLLTDGCLAIDPAEAAVDRIVHDPSNPAPLVGGHVGTPPGFVDRARTDDRADVAVFTTAPYAEDVRIAGDVELRLACEASCARFDLAATVSVVSPGGEAIVLRTAFMRVTSALPEPAAISFRGVFATVPAGHCLRLSVQGAGSPAFDVAHDVAASGQPRPILLTLRHGGEAGSRLVVPCLPCAASRPEAGRDI